MTIKIKQSTASQEIPLGYFVDNTDGDTEETGLTIANTDIKLWKMGAITLADKNSGGATHISNGIYYCVLDATDTDTLGGLIVFVHVSGALAVRVECEVLAANVYDSLIVASDALQVDTIQISGTVQTANDVGADVNDILTDTSTTLQAELDGIQTDTENIQSRIPAALVSGRIDASVGAVASGVITATAIATDAIDADALAADAVTEIQSGLATSSALSTAQDDLDILTGTDGATLATSQPNYAPSYDSDVEDLLTGVTVTTNSDKTGYSLTSVYDPAKTAAQDSDVDDVLTNIAALNDFDPVNDIVAHVTLVDTTTTNTDMRGTDNASQDSDMTVVLTQVNQLLFDSDSYVFANASVTLDSDEIQSIADGIDVPTANENALALLKYDFTGITGEASRSLLNAARFIRNKFSTTANPGSVTIYKEDDTAEAYQKTITTDSDADPIVVG